MTSGELLNRMLLIAVNAHAGQFDKGGKPYVLHPLAVMNYLHTDDEELQCIALGHDVVEDTNVTYIELEKAGMTPRIIAALKLLTKQRGQTHDEYMAGIFTNKDAMLVKLADLRHNSDIRRLKGVTEKDIKRVQKYHEMYMMIKSKLEN